MKKNRNEYRAMVGRSERKRSFGRPRCGWKDNIKVKLQETGYDGVNCIHVARGRSKVWAVVNAVTKFRVSSYAEQVG